MLRGTLLPAHPCQECPKTQQKDTPETCLNYQWVPLGKIAPMGYFLVSKQLGSQMAVT